MTVTNAYCPLCGIEALFQHDHKADNTGLDDGPELHSVRKKADPKPQNVVTAIRARAWETRRMKYGAHGHR